MRRRIALGMKLGSGCVVALAIGCGDAGQGADGGLGAGDARVLPLDGAAERDAGGLALDGGPGADGGLALDGGLGIDGGTVPEVCTGGLDEDGDRQVDCADDACWTFAACIAADVVGTAPDLVPCGDPIELDATATAEACALLGTPAMSMTTTECAAATLEVTAHLFCDGSGAAAALWIEERLETARTTRMLTPRRFEMTYFERASIVDWERQTIAGGAHSGAVPPLHDGRAGDSDTVVFRVVTVRSVRPGDSISRLLGVQHITSIIDLDSPMSMDTRRTLRTGGLVISIP